MGSKSNHILSVIDFISDWEGKIFSVLILFATFVVCLEIVKRYFFGAPSDWGLELSIFLCGITYVTSGAYAHVIDAHIKVDLFYDQWSNRTKAIIDVVFIDMVTFIYVGLLTLKSWEYFWESFRDGLTSGSVWDPIIWPVRLSIFIGASTLFVQNIAKFIRDIRRISDKK